MAVRRILVLAISFYQRFVSPYKGFRCASGVYHGNGSCSGVVKRIILTKGLVAGWQDIRNQFHRCRDAAFALQLINSTTDKSGDSGDDGQIDEDSDERKKKKKRKSCTWADPVAAACVLPDPSDCSFGACGGAADGVAGVCSCF